MNREVQKNSLLTQIDETVKGLLNSNLVGRGNSFAQKLLHKKFPTVEDECWKYTNPAMFLDLVQDVLSNISLNHPAKSSQDCAGQNITEQGHGDFIHVKNDPADGGFEFSRVNQSAVLPDVIKSSPHWFSLFNGSFSKNNFLLKINGNHQFKKPLVIERNNIKGQNSHDFLSQLTINVERNSQVTIIEKFSANHQKSPVRLLATTFLNVSEGATVEYVRIVDTNDEHVGQVYVNLEQQSCVNVFTSVSQSKKVRLDVDVQYLAENASCSLNGLALVKDLEHVDFHSFVNHSVHHCVTLQLFKGVLAGKSRGVFNGRILIQKGTKGSEAYQTNKNLMLSKNAVMNTKPQLEINSDDVKASHGAALGFLNADELFYLKSRCISDKDAVSLLSRGFTRDVLQKVKSDDARLMLEEHVEQWFKHLASATGVP